ncbi:MAG: molybdopterin-dependent oxidoreductase [Clostridiaceae bacterium]
MKKIKKLFIAFLTFAMLMGMTSVCFAAGTTLPTGTWSVNFVVDGVTHKVTSTDVAKLTPYSFTASYTKNDAQVSHLYTGVSLKDILKSIGVTDVTTVSATATDGYKMKVPYDKATAMNEKTLLAWGMDGVAMDDSHGPVMLIPGGSNTVSSQFAKMVKTVTVTGATLEKASTTTSTKASTKTSTATTSTTTSNPTTGDSSPVSVEIILLAVASMLALTTTAIGMRKSLKRK